MKKRSEGHGVGATHLIDLPLLPTRRPLLFARSAIVYGAWSRLVGAPLVLYQLGTSSVLSRLYLRLIVLLLVLLHLAVPVVLIQQHATRISGRA